MRSHTGDKPYQCSQYDCAFSKDMVIGTTMCRFNITDLEMLHGGIINFLEMSRGGIIKITWRCTNEVF